MKRSRSIRLVLIGGISAGTLTSCGPPSQSVTVDDVFTNNHYVPGVGYYHAPFRAWYALPYNHYDPSTARYFQGGAWAAAPHRSVVNISSPLPSETQRLVQQNSTRRSGFGSTSRGHSWTGS